MAKKTTKGSRSGGRAKRKGSQAKDLPAGRKAQTVRGGAFSAGTLTTGLRNTLSGIRSTF